LLVFIICPPALCAPLKGVVLPAQPALMISCKASNLLSIGLPIYVARYIRGLKQFLAAQKIRDVAGSPRNSEAAQRITINIFMIQAFHRKGF
jgi:hypothetical protein